MVLKDCHPSLKHYKKQTKRRGHVKIISGLNILIHNLYFPPVTISGIEKRRPKRERTRLDDKMGAVLPQASWDSRDHKGGVQVHGGTVLMLPPG